MPNKPTVCLACLHNQADAQFMNRWLSMLNYDWVTESVSVKTDAPPSGVLSKTIDGKRRTSLHDNYGVGFDKQPSAGGFHELRARNDLLRLAEKTGCDWILLADPDELFRDETFHEIQLANRVRKDVVWFECYHYCAPNQYLWWPDTLRQIHGSRRKLHDAHPRAIRASAKLRYVQNNNNAFRKRLRNHTMHCHLQPHSSNAAHIAYGIHHIHTRHMFDPKRPDPERLTKFDKKISPYTLPELYVNAFNNQ